MKLTTTFTCPVCGYGELPQPPANYEICPSCATEFGYDDFTVNHAELRARWLDAGASWRATWQEQPAEWDGLRQLFNSGLLAVTVDASDAEQQIDDARQDNGDPRAEFTYA